MKALKIMTSALVAAAAMLSFASCEKDTQPDYTYPNYFVTVKPDAENTSFYLQLDEKTTGKVVNMDKSPFGKKEVRALAYITEEAGEHEGFDKAVKVHWMDSILTKKPVLWSEEMGVLGKTGSKAGEEGDGSGEGDGNGTETPETDYGTDPIDILRSRMTLVEDGYLNIHFRVYAENYSSKHFLNILYNVEGEENTIEFRHNDGIEYNSVGYGYARDGFVAFKLKDVIPDTEGKTVDLKLRWRSANEGVKEITVKYCTPEN